MKRITFLIAFFSLLLVDVNAQTFDNVASLEGGIRYIPDVYSATGKKVLWIQSSDKKFYFLNEDFSFGKEIFYNLSDSALLSEYVDFHDYDNESWVISDKIFLTQTLFNNDDKVEFIRRIGDVYYSGSYAYIENCRGYEIVNEDNEVLYTFPETSFDLRVYRWNEKDFLSFYYEGTGISNIYAINKNGGESSISKVKTLPGLSASPVLANRNSVVDVTIDEAAAANGGELVIVDNSGRIVAKQQFKPGQTTVTVQTDRMRTGVYNITFNNGEKIDNARIIVK